MEVISPAPREKQPKTSETGKKSKIKISREDQKIWQKNAFGLQRRWPQKRDCSEKKEREREGGKKKD
jgi:hypothetical protein